jgi:hypothetical protein
MTSICLVSTWRIIVLVNIDTFNAAAANINDELENGDDNDDDDDSDDELENVDDDDDV